MKKFTLSGFLNFFTSKDLAFNNNGESGFKLDFSKENLKQKVNSNQSSKSGISSIIILLVLFLFSNFLTAQITLDGNPSDWEATLAIPGGVKARIIDPIDGNDNIWIGGGSKDINPISQWKYQINGSNDKNNIVNAGYYLDGTKLFFFSDRLSNNGDSAIGFWILQGTVSQIGVSGGNFSGAHQDGDILMISHFVNGGSVAEIQAFRWDKPGAGDGALNATPIPLPTSGLNAVVNTAPVASPASWNYVPKAGPANFYPINSFFEGFIDLSSVNFNLSVCLGTFLVETRQSQSLSSVLEDLSFGRFGSVPEQKTLLGSSFCNSIPNSGTITMNSSQTGVSYQLKKDSDNTLVQSAKLGTNGTLIWTALPAGSYYVVAINTTSGCPIEIGRPTIVTAIASPIVTVNSPVKCANDAAVNITASVSPAGTYTYVWTVPLSASNPGNVASFSSSVAGTYSVVVSNATCSGSNSGILTVNPNPTCSISGASSVCPNSIGNMHSGPAGAGLTYAWSISGNGSIVGPANEQNISVTAGSACGVSYTVSLTVITAQNCSSTCTKTVSVGDSIAPSFTFCPPGSELGCNPAGVPEPGNATATDNCGVPTITSALGSITSNGCLRSQTRTYTATDSCGNTATCAQVFTWTADLVLPVIATTSVSGDKGCNPTIIPPVFTLTEACSPGDLVTGTTGITGDGCAKSQTWTANFTDACNNLAVENSITFTWKVDTTVPVITVTNANQGTDLGCNPTAAQITASLDGATANDNCDG
ncbi:hypothetical protein, partial [Flavobacterium sp.]|uniref:hypothetical protein n=1 Tax=Flavobacterium sp. TaxID=239 RepID=UPI00286CDFEF